MVALICVFGACAYQGRASLLCHWLFSGCYSQCNVFARLYAHRRQSEKTVVVLEPQLMVLLVWNMERLSWVHTRTQLWQKVLVRLSNGSCGHTVMLHPSLAHCGL